MDIQYDSFIKKILFALMNLASFPCIYFVQLSNGLDPSWIFALNAINQSDAKFGRDYFFTYGPLGFLGRCQAIGNNLDTGMLFWMLVTVMQIYLYKRLFDYTDHTSSIVIASALLILASPVMEADIYLCFLNLTALLLVYKYEDFCSKGISVILSGVIFLFKFSGTILLAATLFMLIICALAERKPAKRIRVYLCCMVTGPVFYLFYDPSVRSLFRYARAAAEISLGYNTSMSLDEYEAYYIWVILVVVCYVFLLLYAFKHNKQWSFFLILAPSGFFWYKEGFVRNDGHYLLALMGLLLICSLLMFFADFKEWVEHTEWDSGLKAAMCCLCMLVVIPVMGNGKTLGGSLQSSASNLFHLPKLLDDCSTQDRALLQEHNQEFMEMIGDHTYTTFPWEITENISYANQNFRIAPLLQNYTVYTPYLDRLNAAFYTGDDAPEYIILYLNTIDGRLPLIETPATWENIYRNYDVAASDEEKFLLKKREQALVKETSELQTKKCGTGEYIEIPENCTFVKIKTKFGVKGRLENFFYKIQRVNLEVTYLDGSVKAGRVILDNLREGIEIGSLIWDGTDFTNYMNLEKRDKAVAGIALTGPGICQYDGSMEVVFYSGGWK